MANKFLLLLVLKFCIFLSLAAPPKYDPCEDRYVQCKMWSAQNICNSTTYKEYMLRTCPVSCNFCKNIQGIFFNQPEPQNESIIPLAHAQQTYQEFRLPSSDASQQSKQFSGNKPNDQSMAAVASSDDHNRSNTMPTAIPQAMRLIQSLTQMISQSSSKKGQIESLVGSANKKNFKDENAKKKHTLEKQSGKRAVLIPETLKRQKARINDDETDIEEDDKTLKMLIQNRKRSQVHKNGSTKKREKSPHKKSSGSEGHKNDQGKNKPSIHRHRVVSGASRQQYKPNFEVQQTYPTTESTTSTTTEAPIQANEPNIEESNDESNDNASNPQPPPPNPPPSPPNQTEPLTQEEAPNVEEPDIVEVTTTPLQEVVPSENTSEPTEEQTPQEESQCENDDCGVRYSLILKQQFDPDYQDTSSTKYSILKGNIVQDVGYALGSDATVSEVEFEVMPSKNESEGCTKVYFTINGDRSNLGELKDMVDKGNVNGLLVQPNSLEQE